MQVVKIMAYSNNLNERQMKNKVAEVWPLVQNTL